MAVSNISNPDFNLFKVNFFMRCDRRQGQCDSATQRTGHVFHGAAMDGSQAVPAANGKAGLAGNDICAFIR